MPTENLHNRVMGLDGKMYIDESNQQTEMIDKMNDLVQNSKVDVKTGLIMDELNSKIPLKSENDKTSLEEFNDNVQKLDEKSIKQLLAYQAHIPNIREYNIGRNDPCPCGSGKKYKNCCLKTGKYEKLIKKK